MTDAAEARIAALRARFLDRCREDLAVLTRAPDGDQLRTVLHRLAGAGGTFGYPEVSRLAAQSEDALLSGRAPDLAPLIATLEALPGRPPG